MLELRQNTGNAWVPPRILEEEKEKIRPEYEESFVIFRTEPYIDAYYIHYDKKSENPTAYMKRFSFHEGYRWSYAEEDFFEKKCLSNDDLYFNSDEVDAVFEYYSKKYPDWKLKRYYTKSMRLFDHIYHCMRRDSAKEMLYKAGLDELAANIGLMEEIDLMSSKPSDLYDGVSMRVLRALNCVAGAQFLSKEYNREFVKKLQAKYPVIFEEKMNDAQCRYLNYLINGDLTVGEAGRLFNARRKQLKGMWAPAQYQLFVQREREMNEMSELTSIDPIYKEFVEKKGVNRDKILELKHYLVRKREEYDVRFRRSNRKRKADWEERNNGYVVRYPQTINDFCREAVYMSNCLLTYVEAYLHNDTTILLMRKTDDYNAPFITIEIFGNRLTQAYHRFNEDCTKEEADWIIDYCRRHGIERGEFLFDHNIDLLF